MSFEVIQGDIRKCKVDAIVIPANPKPIVGKGVDRLIYHEAGRNRLLKKRREIGEIEFGHACITDAYDLRKKGVKYIIHAVSPAYDHGNSGEKWLLELCYEKALELAFTHNCKSVAFPLLSTGVLGYPKEEAQSIAESVCKNFCRKHDLYVCLVIYVSEETVIVERERLDRYIEENTYSCLDVEDYRRKEKEWGSLPDWREEKAVLDLMRKRFARKQIDDEGYHRFLKHKSKQEESVELFFHMATSADLDSHIMKSRQFPAFGVVLDQFKEKKGFKNYHDLCERAWIKEDTMSRLRSGGVGEKSRRDCLWALSIALQLKDRNDVEELFNSAGLCSFRTPGMNLEQERRERALEFFVENGWSMKDVNAELERRGMKVLGNNMDNSIE